VGWTTGRASKGGLEAEPPAGSRALTDLPTPRTPPPEKLIGSASISGTPSGKSGVEWTCPPQSTPWRRLCPNLTSV